MPLPVTNIASIYHFQRTGNTEEYSATPDYQNVNVCVSPTGTDIQASFGDVPSYQLFEIFIPDITIQVKNGDKIVTDEGVTYLVDGVPFTPKVQYLQYTRVMARMVV
ncbi:MAG TPA: hypothetical protein VH186_06250 [Chloroflexia bacterium]|nr:hypothetical protein [Chloroflexia bacterium]